LKELLTTQQSISIIIYADINVNIVLSTQLKLTDNLGRV